MHVTYCGECDERVVKTVEIRPIFISGEHIRCIQDKKSGEKKLEHDQVLAGNLFVLYLYDSLIILEHFD